MVYLLVRTKNNMTNNKVIIPEVLVHKIMLMTYELNPHPLARIIKKEKEICYNDIKTRAREGYYYYEKNIHSPPDDDLAFEFMDWYSKAYSLYWRDIKKIKYLLNADTQGKEYWWDCIENGEDGGLINGLIFRAIDELYDEM